MFQGGDADIGGLSTSTFGKKRKGVFGFFLAITHICEVGVLLLFMQK